MLWLLTNCVMHSMNIKKTTPVNDVVFLIMGFTEISCLAGEEPVVELYPAWFHR
jgi:hypothetical protein